MGKITPHMEGKFYETWQLLMNFMLIPLNKKLDEDYDPGFRLSTIINCWVIVESFCRDCLKEECLRNYRHFDLAPKWSQQYTKWERLLMYLRIRKASDFYDWSKSVTARSLYVTRIEKAAWGELQSISKEMGFDIKTIDHTIWEYLKHLYNLRNGFVHGTVVEIMKSNTSSNKSQINKKYQKALKYLIKEKVIDESKLFGTQRIDELLNFDVTRLLIDKLILALDALAELYNDTTVSGRWNQMKP